MYVILVYDMGEKRVNKALKICRKYLNWVQNSVFEGEITGAKLTRLKGELKRVMEDEEDSVIIYQFRTLNYSKREVMGVEKGGEEYIL
ncbi:CRISPR-associated endonuclease Cas2 [Caldithrix abyssi]